MQKMGFKIKVMNLKELEVNRLPPSIGTPIYPPKP